MNLDISEQNFRDQIMPGFGFRMGIALAIAGQSMIFGLGYNIALTHGEAPRFGSLPYLLIHGSLFLSALLVIILIGKPLLNELWLSVKKIKIQVEALFAISLIGAMGGSLINSLSGKGSVYYELVAVVLAIYAFGKQVSTRKRSEALNAARQMKDEYQTAEKILSAENKQDLDTAGVFVNELSVGDLIYVRRGSRLTMDGLIHEGKGYWQESAVNGEPIPRCKIQGDSVLSGAIAVDADFIVEVRKVEGERFIDQVLKSVEASSWQTTRIQRLADRLTMLFVPFVCLISLAAFFVGIGVLSLDWSEALFRAMSVLLIACPCALGISLPIGLWSGLYRLSDIGLISHSAEILDRLAHCDRIFFDKTGTLSLPQIAIDSFSFIDNRESIERVKSLVGSIEMGLDHPIAKSLFDWSGIDSKDVLVVKGREILEGQGIAGTIEDQYIQVCDPAHVDAKNIPSERRSLVLQIDERIVGYFVLREVWRNDLEMVFGFLKEEGIKVSVLTGDSHPPHLDFVEAEVHSGLSSAQKKERIKRAKEVGESVLFVGDGINDAEAMEEAGASIAVSDGTSFSKSVASATFVGVTLMPLIPAVKISRKVITTMESNFKFALFYNLFGISLAFGGYLHPVAAALIMIVSSLFVSWRAVYKTQT